MAILAAGLIILGVPQLLLSTSRKDAGLEADSKDLAARDRLADQAEALAAAAGDPQSSIRGGLLRLELAFPQDAAPDRAVLEKAALDLESGLSRAPANARAWAALSHADLSLGHPDAAAKALSAGLFSGQSDPALNPSWCVLGLALWPHLEAPQQARIAEEIRWAWRDRRPLIQTLAHTDADSAARLRAVLDPGARDEFDRLLQDSAKG